MSRFKFTSGSELRSFIEANLYLLFFSQLLRCYIVFFYDVVANNNRKLITLTDSKTAQDSFRGSGLFGDKLHSQRLSEFFCPNDTKE